MPYFILFGCIIGSVKYQAKPLIIYTSTKSEESFLCALQRGAHLLVQLWNMLLGLVLLSKVMQMEHLRLLL